MPKGKKGKRWAMNPNWASALEDAEGPSRPAGPAAPKRGAVHVNVHIHNVAAGKFKVKHKGG